MTVVCFHLYSDYSGSPKILKSVIEGLLDKGHKVDLITSKGGIFSELRNRKNIFIHTYRYRFSKFAILTFLYYSYIQLYSFFYALKYFHRKDVVFYINTILPVGAALAGFFMKKKVVYHCHENVFVKGFFYKLLAQIMYVIASDIICVSEYQKNLLTHKMKIIVVPNAVPISFYNKFANINVHFFSSPPRILMLSSLKKYKGIIEFVELSKRLLTYQFHLVINNDLTSINSFIENNNINLGVNLFIYDQQTDIIQFYEKADLVLNLTNSKEFVETFGLTALEAMTAALPVIVPTIGGIAELVQDGYNGYKRDASELDSIMNCIEHIFSDSELYHSLSLNAKKMAIQFSFTKMIDAIEKIILS